MKPDGRNVAAQVTAMYDETMTAVGSCPHSRQVIWLLLSEEAEIYDVLRVRKA